MTKKMDDQQLKSIIANELHNALGRDGGQLSTDRRKLLEYYQAKPFGNEMPGRSQVITKNVLEAVEWTLPVLLRLFCQTDNVVEFSPTNPNDEELAAQVTDYVNFVLTRDNNFMMLCHDFFKDALIQRVGYVRVAYENTKRYSTATYEALTDMEYQQITQADDVEIIDEKTYPNPDPMMSWYTEDSPNPKAPELHDIRIRITHHEGRVKITNVPPESMLISRRAPSTLLDGRHFLCHRCLVTVSELRELDYDEDDIQAAIGGDAEDWNTETLARFDTADEWPLQDNSIDPSMRTVWLEESYLPIDYMGTGVAELRRIISARDGAIIFENEPADDVPFVAICPIPMSHKHVGLGLGDLTSDLQELKSSIVRSIMDNAYLTNSPRFAIAESAMTTESIDDLLNVRPGGIVRVADIAGIQSLPVAFVAGQTLPLVTYLDETQEIRTGISRRGTVGLTPDDLNRTATAVNAQMNGAAQRAELIARIFAEQGIKVLAKKVLALVIKFQQKGRIIRLRDKYVEMDTRDWHDNYDVSITVGLGTGNRDQALMQLMNILQIQNQIVQLQQGIEGPIVTGENIYDVLRLLTQNAGFKQEFFTDPKTMPAPQQGQQKPSPQELKAKADIEAKMARTQADIAAQRLKSQNDMALENADAQNQMRRDEISFQHQMELERMRAEVDILLEQMKLGAANAANPRAPQNLF